MTSLTELQRMAEEATPGPWLLATSNSWRRFVTKYDTREVCVPTRQRDGHPDLHFPNPADAMYMEAMSPDTAQRLIAVALALESLRGKPVWDQLEAEADCDALLAALDAIRNDTEKT